MTEHRKTGPEGRQHISGREARGGEIILRSRLMRGLFIAGLVGAVLIALLWLF